MTYTFPRLPPFFFFLCQVLVWRHFGCWSPDSHLCPRRHRRTPPTVFPARQQVATATPQPGTHQPTCSCGSVTANFSLQQAAQSQRSPLQLGGGVCLAPSLASPDGPTQPSPGAAHPVTPSPFWWWAPNQ